MLWRYMKIIDVRDSSPRTCWLTTFCANGLILAIVGLAASFCFLLRGSGGRPRGNRTPWACWRLEHRCTGRIHWNTATMCDFMVFISSSLPTRDCGIWKMIVYSTENLRYGWEGRPGGQESQNFSLTVSLGAPVCATSWPWFFGLA